MRKNNMAESMTKIFVSYAHKDIKQVKRILKEINSLGFDYWIDERNLQGGDRWTQVITEAILASDKFLLVMSAASMESDNIGQEVQIAFENKIKIIILKLEDVEVPVSLKYPLIRNQWIDHSRTDWKSRLAISLGKVEIQSPTVHEIKKISHRTVAQLQSESGSGSTRQIIEAIKILENTFAYGTSFYKDQCVDAIMQVEVILNLAGYHWINSLSDYKSRIPRINLVSKLDDLKKLIAEFKNTCPPGSAEIRKAIQQKISNMLDEMN
jgi:hypothetical protein